MARRLPQAPEAPMPELAECLAPFRVHVVQRPSARTLERYVTGLLTEHPHKNCDTLAAVVPGTTEPRLNHLLTEMVWDEQDLNRQRIRAMLALHTEGDGVLICDDTGFATQGRHSVGVARQYSGTLGKVGNCQVTVNGHYAERTVAWPVATRLYLPEAWAADAARRAAAHVPPDVAFQTKPELALALVDEARAGGVLHACVVADADYGDHPRFLNGLAARGERGVVAVRADFTVATTRTGAGQRAEAVLTARPPGAWRTLTWREGSRDRPRARVVARRAWRVDGDGTRHRGWLIGQRPGRGQSGDPKYCWSSFGPQTPLERMVEYTHRRWWVEQYHEEAKGELGWDQFQGRRWDAFHRHAVTVMLTYSVLVWLEWRERQPRRPRGRPRGACSPSAGSAAPLAAEPAPHDRRPAAAGGAARPPHGGSPHARSPMTTLTKQY